MVLVHKLKQMEELDIEQFRDPADGDTSGVSSPTESGSINPQKSQRRTSQRKRQHSPPRRPTTRSQTGHLAKRRRHDDESEDEESDHHQQTQQPPATAPAPAAPQLKLESAFAELIKTHTAVVDQGVQAMTDESAIATASGAPHVAPAPGQLTFLGNEVDPSSQDRRGPRSRAVHPVPVPNLTKKSRGRRVPTKSAAEKEATAANSSTSSTTTEKMGRLYVCKVEDCGKCFNRGEHLKRHIRSIHTHEKPFKCSHPACDKFFNRHDNLLQHLKVHKDLAPELVARAMHGPPQTVSNGMAVTQTLSGSPAIPIPTSIPTMTQSPADARPLATAQAVATEYQPPAASLATNMNISSVRTAIDPVLSDPSFTGILPVQVPRPTSEADIARARDLHDALGAVIQAITALGGGAPIPTADELAELASRPHLRRKYGNEATPSGGTPRQSPPPLLMSTGLPSVLPASMPQILPQMPVAAPAISPDGLQPELAQGQAQQPQAQPQLPMQSPPAAQPVPQQMGQTEWQQ